MQTGLAACKVGCDEGREIHSHERRRRFHTNNTFDEIVNYASSNITTVPIKSVGKNERRMVIWFMSRNRFRWQIA